MISEHLIFKIRLEFFFIIIFLFFFFFRVVLAEELQAWCWKGGLGWKSGRKIGLGLK